MKLCGRPDCVVCFGDGWVCETHPEFPWDSWHQLNCGPGAPCRCSPAHPDNWTPEERRAALERIQEFDQRLRELAPSVRRK